MAYPKCNGKLPASRKERTDVIRFLHCKEIKVAAPRKMGRRTPRGDSEGQVQNSVWQFRWAVKGCWWLSSTTVSEDMERSKIETYFCGCL